MLAPEVWASAIRTISSTLTFGAPSEGEHDAVGDILGVQRPAHRDPGVHGLAALLVPVKPHFREVGLDQTGRDVRDPHRNALQVVAERSRVTVHGELRRDIRRAARVRPDAGDRAEVDDVAVARADQMRQAEARHAHQPEHVRLDHLPLVDVARLPDGVAAAREPGVVDEDVEPAEVGEGLLDEALAACRVGHVEVPVAAGAGVHASPGLGERPRRRGADPARRTGDDRPPAVESRHRREPTGPGVNGRLKLNRPADV